MNEDEFTEMIKGLSNLLKCNGFDVVGCSDEQIVHLEDRYGKLPLFYKLFLKYLGLKAGDFKVGTWMFYSDIEDINTETIELMRNNNIIPPLNFFAYLMHQGYTSLFFTDKNSNDPKIYCYTECEDIIDIGKTFSSCIKADIDEYLS